MHNDRNLATLHTVMGALLFICALIFYYFAVLKIDYYKTDLLYLGWSDPAQYFAQAKAMLKGELPYLNYGFAKLPPMYPPGYPALMLPWLKILRHADSIIAPYRTNQTMGLLLLFGVFGFYLYLAKPLSGGFAAILLATLPAFFTFCRSPMSEIAGAGFVALAFMFAYLGLKEKRRWKIYASAAFLGLAVDTRIQSLFFAPLLLAMPLFPGNESRARWLLHCLALPIVLVVALSPLLILNSVQFHSPFQTGYAFWIDRNWLAHTPPFSLRYIPNNSAMLWRELALRPQPIMVARSFGTGTYFVTAFILLICLGMFFIRPNRFVICAFLASLTFLALTISYQPKWMDLRFYVPLLILLVSVAVLPVTWAAENLFLPKRTIASLAIFALFAAACLGYPSRSVDRDLKANRLQSWEALHFNPRRQGSDEFIAQQRFIKSVGKGSGIVFSDINPVYLNALFSSGFVAAPLDGKKYAGFRHVLHYDRAEAIALAERGLNQSIPVYALFISTKELDEKASRLPNVPGYQWIRTENYVAKTVILRLTSNQ
jgi:hypothetical protein